MSNKSDTNHIKGARGFKYGDKVRLAYFDYYYPDLPVGSLGTVSAIHGIRGVSVSPDPVRMMIFVDFGEHGYRSVKWNCLEKIGKGKTNPQPGIRSTVKRILHEHGYDGPFALRTVGFSDLARGDRLFCDIKDKSSFNKYEFLSCKEALSKEGVILSGWISFANPTPVYKFQERFFIDYSSEFGVKSYDTVTIKKVLAMLGAKNIRTSPLHGWFNQPKVVTFTLGANDPLTYQRKLANDIPIIERALGEALGLKYPAYVMRKDW